MVRAGRFIGGFVLSLLLLPAAIAHADGILEKMQNDVATIVTNARPGIVSIEDERIASRPSTNSVQNGKPADGAGDRGGRRQGGMRRVTGDTPKVGSGFSIGEGYIVTTSDVLSGMKNPLVMTDDGKRIRAVVVSIDTEMNIGLLKLASTTTIPALKLGYSSAVVPGHFAISIGNQNGHTNTVALTMVAGIRNEGIPTFDHFYPGLIQIAGTVGAGTSGAPILNARGEVIGMIVAVPGDWTEGPGFPMRIPGREGPGKPNPPQATPAQSSQPNVVSKTDEPKRHPNENLNKPDDLRTQKQEASNGEQSPIIIRPPVSSAGFALPIDDMKPVMKALAEKRVTHCWLGVDMSDDRKLDDHDGIVTVHHTIRVKTVYPDSPAAGGGLQQGDTLLSLNGKPMTRLYFLKATTMRLQPGENLEIKISRNGSSKTLNIKMAARPDQNKQHFTQ